jgi:SAM-dependent methyltransferase
MFRKYAQFYNAINSKKPYQKECEFVYEWAGKPKSILDIGCGTANYWQYFPVRPTGVELSPMMIEQSPYKDYIINADITDAPIMDKTFDCAIALFDVINYIPVHDWWKYLPIKQGGYFIFDMWDKNKAKKEGFKVTDTKCGDICRVIIPKVLYHDTVELSLIVIENNKLFKEKHTMYLYSEEDLRGFCGREFNIVDKLETESWQTWYKIEKL